MEIGKTPPEVTNYLDKKAQAVEKPLPKIEEVDPRLVEIADKVAEISGAWNPVEIYTADPDNIKQEQQKFFGVLAQSQEYNPQFTYSYAETLDLDAQKEQLRQLLSELRKLQVPPVKEADRLARVALYFKIKDDLATCDLVEGIKTKNEPKIAQALAAKYRGTDPVLTAVAQKEYERLTQIDKAESEAVEGLLTTAEKQWLKGKKYSAEEIKSAFEWALQQYGLLKRDDKAGGYAVVINEKTTSIDVRDKSALGPTIFIPKDRMITAEELLLLISHEIEGHARQSANGEKLFKIGGGRWKIDEESLYEGLAMRLEAQFKKKYFGGEERTPLPFYTLAVAKAEAGSSFYDIFQEQLNMRLHVTLHIASNNNLPTEVDKAKYEEAKKGAWGITYRIMRGHTDTSNQAGFAMAKDLAYLRGYLIDKQLVDRGFGPINETAVFAGGALQLVAGYKLEEQDLPYQYQDAAGKYWEQVLKPQINQ